MGLISKPQRVFFEMRIGEAALKRRHTHFDSGSGAAKIPDFRVKIPKSRGELQWLTDWLTLLANRHIKH